jgi:transposase
MGRPYSDDLRIRIVTTVEAGASCSAAARQFGVSISCGHQAVAALSPHWIGGARGAGQEALCVGR